MSLNKLLRAHWTKRRRDLEAWRWHIRRACGRPRRYRRLHRGRRLAPRAQGPDRGSPAPGSRDAQGPPKAHLRIAVHRRRRQDPDNAQASVKHILDALVREGWLADDSPEHVTLEVLEHVEARKRAQRTEITLSPAGRDASYPGARPLPDTTPAGLTAPPPAPAAELDSFQEARVTSWWLATPAPHLSEEA